jgi:hypothetical protein
MEMSTLQLVALLPKTLGDKRGVPKVSTIFFLIKNRQGEEKLSQVPIRKITAMLLELCL